MYLRTKGIKINLDLEVTLYLRTQSIRMTPQTQLIFDKSDVRSLSLKKKDVLPQTIKRKKLMFIITKLSRFVAPKILYSLL